MNTDRADTRTREAGDAETRGRRFETERRGDVSSWRMFCAIELPDHLRSQLQDRMQRLREVVPEATASWSRPENIHLTLKFFGNVAKQRVAGISAAASRTAQGFSPFHITAGATGVFPKPNRPKVLWIGVDDLSGKLSTLQRKLETECDTEGFQKEDRAFRPHLTIARIGRPEGARRLAETHRLMEFRSVEVAVTELIVFRSELSSKGSKYTRVSAHSLDVER